MGEKKLFQEQLKESQPVAYQTLKNGLQNNKLSHAYIFAGPKGTKKKETAYLLAQSLICEHRDPFACEESGISKITFRSESSAMYSAIALNEIISLESAML